MSCFTCSEQLPNAYLSVESGKCFCGRACHQAYASPQLEADIARLSKEDSDRVNVIEIIFLKACLRRSPKAQLLRIRTKYMEALTDMLMEFEKTLPSGIYVEVANACKINLSMDEGLIACFGS
jgi:recombinational DNA repair protein (RecF pathway)